MSKCKCGHDEKRHKLVTVSGWCVKGCKCTCFRPVTICTCGHYALDHFRCDRCGGHHCKPSVGCCSCNLYKPRKVKSAK
jgi:hypothetical protein